MASERGMLAFDAPQRVAHASGHPLAGAFNLVGGPTWPSTEAVGAGEVGDEGFVLLAGMGGGLDVAASLCLADVLFELAEPSLVRLVSGLVDERVAVRVVDVQARRSGLSSTDPGRCQAIAGQVQDVDLLAW